MLYATLHRVGSFELSLEAVREDQFMGWVRGKLPKKEKIFFLIFMPFHHFSLILIIFFKLIFIIFLNYNIMFEGRTTKPIWLRRFKHISGWIFSLPNKIIASVFISVNELAFDKTQIMWQCSYLYVFFPPYNVLVVMFCV